MALRGSYFRPKSDVAASFRPTVAAVANGPPDAAASQELAIAAAEKLSSDSAEDSEAFSGSQIGRSCTHARDDATSITNQGFFFFRKVIAKGDTGTFSETEPFPSLVFWSVGAPELCNSLLTSSFATGFFLQRRRRLPSFP